jgi:hypothetical protein
LTTSVFCTSQTTATDGSTRASSSIARMLMKKLAPAPPQDSGISMPIKPSSKSHEITSGCSLPSRSISAASGRRRSSAKARTVARNRLSSSASVVSAG